MQQVKVLASCALSVASYHLLFIMPVLLLSTAKWQLIITVLMKWGLIKHNEIRLYGRAELSCGTTTREQERYELCSIRDECRACKRGGETRHGEEEEQGEGMGEWWLCEADELLDCALCRSTFIIRGQKSAMPWCCCSTSLSLFQRSSRSDVFIYSK